MKISKTEIKTFLISILVIVIVFFPKLNLIDIAGSSTGIRIDDILLAIILLVLFPKHIRECLKDPNVRPISKYFILYIIACFISVIWGYYSKYISLFSGILYFVRKIEYFVLLFIGYYYYKNNKLNNTYINLFFDFIVIFHLVFVLLQYFGLMGSFHAGDMISTLTQNRVSSTFNGAYELSGFLLLLVPYYINSLFKNKTFKKSNLIMLFIIFFIIFISQSRISLAAFIVLTILMMYKLGTKAQRKTITVSIPVFVVIGIMAVSLGTSKISDRMKSVSLSNAMAATACAWNYKNFDVYKTYGYWYTNFSCITIGNDYSWNLRVSHWMQLVDGLLRSPILGNGLSVTSSAADGEYVRVLSESGLLGLMLFILYIHALFKQFRKNKNSINIFIVRYALIGMLIGSVFIDIFSASKIAMMFYFMLGYSIASLGEKDEELNNSK